MLVEDDPNSRAALREYLEDAGYVVDVATDGSEVAARVAAQRPSAVVIDLVLPGVNGLDLARLLRSDPATADLPLIAVTASWLGSKPDWLQEIGFNRALRKPFSADRLLDALKQVLLAPKSIALPLQG